MQASFGFRTPVSCLRRLSLRIRIPDGGLPQGLRLSVFGFRVWRCAALLTVFTLSSLAQSPPRSQDPLMLLMLSQPRIDVESPVIASASFDPFVVRPGELAIYRVTLNALEESIDWPDKLPVPTELDLRPAAHGQMFQMLGPALVPRTSFNYRVRVGSPGQFTVPGFTINVYGKPITVPPARLDVVSAPSALLPPAQQLKFQLAGTNLYVGQPVRATILLPGYQGGVVRSLTQVQLNGPNIIADLAAARARVEVPPLPGGGAGLPLFIFETTLTPLTAGKISVFAQGFADDHRPIAALAGTNSALPRPTQPQFTLLDSAPIELDVRSLPHAGELPGFTGAIGAYRLSPPILSTNLVRAGDSLSLSVKVLADTNSSLTRLVPPPPPRVPDWQVFAAPPENLPPQAVQARGFATFNFTLIPLADTVRATPAIPFSCFDPDRGAYSDLTIPPVPITVQPGATPQDLQTLLQANAAADAVEKEPGLADLASSPGRARSGFIPLQQRAWFPVVQLGPGAAFLGLWGWDRRRRHLEKHPEILLRRRARRAMRRQWRAMRRAARAGDASRFAVAGVNALIEACAPHYPAEPRALVCGDVLTLLPEPDRSGRLGDVVRRFFAVTDAARFALTQPSTLDLQPSTSTASPTQPSLTPSPSALLPLQPDLEHLLTQFEERL